MPSMATVRSVTVDQFDLFNLSFTFDLSDFDLSLSLSLTFNLKFDLILA